MKLPLTAAAVLALAATATAGCRSGSSGSAAGLGNAPKTAQRAPARAANDAVEMREPGASMSDEEIAKAVLRELVEDGAVGDADFRVTCTNGIVEIAGRADNILSKELATRHAEVVRGVRAVTNYMRVEAPRVADDELARDVRAAIAVDPAASVEDLVVRAHDGAVAIAGKVSSFEQRLVVDRIAKRVRGVRAVDDELAVQPTSARSDADIARDAEARLRWDVLVDQGLIGIDVRDAKVSLHGIVGSAAEKRHAEYDAWVAGVKAVDASALDVNPLVGGDRLRGDKYVIRSDADIARAIRDALTYDPRVSTFRVHVAASGGVATLTGTVSTIAARNAAEDDARHTVGVLSVNNHLEVRPPKTVGDVELRDQVETALRRNPFTDDREITTQADHGRVVLTGKVDTNFEKAEAEAVASSISGVSDVVNRLAVERPSAAYVRDAYAAPYQPEIRAAYLGPASPGKPDAQIVTDIERELAWSPFVRDDHVEISVRNGKATVTGAVDTPREKDVVTENALEAGAILVDNQLAVSEPGGEGK